MTGIKETTATSVASSEGHTSPVALNRDNGHVALFMRDLKGGGIQKNLLRLAESFSKRGLRVDLVICKAKGPYEAHIPHGVNLVALESKAFRSTSRLLATADVLAAEPPSCWPALQPVLLPPWAQRVSALARYLQQARPQALLAAGNILNCIALLARRRVDAPTRLVVSERNHLSAYIQGKSRPWRWRRLPKLIARTYPWADAVVAVSDGVADDLALSTGLPRERITTVYNPIVSEELFAQANAPLHHTWFAPDAPPVVLGTGSLDPKKDFPTLLRAFARVRRQRRVRLMILGEGKGRTELEALAEELDIVYDLALPGFVANPFAYMARSAVFVLSSTYEGLPTVLIEALACGCPIVSTDCPSGPAEILQDGLHGQLVGVGDDRALAEAITAALDDPPDTERLRRRAAAFSVEHGAQRYLEVMLDGLRCER